MEKIISNTLGIIVLTILMVLLASLVGCSNNNQETTEDVLDEYQGMIVLNNEKVGENNCFSEKEVTEFLRDKGFTGEITTNYSIDGEYSSNKVIGETDEKHPTYQLMFMTDTKVWSVLVQGKQICATQVGQSVIYSEDKYLVSYDSQLNSFYEIIPTSVSIKTVDEISAIYLASL